MNEQLKPTSAEEINAKANEPKMVQVPSGDVYQIKKVPARHFVIEVNLPIEASNDIKRTKEEEEELLTGIYEKMSVEEKAAAKQTNRRLICAACVSPKVTLKPEEGAVFIDIIGDKDFYFLLGEIRSFTKGDIDVKNS